MTANQRRDFHQRLGAVRTRNRPRRLLGLEIRLSPATLQGLSMVSLFSGRHLRDRRVSFRRRQSVRPERLARVARQLKAALGQLLPEVLDEVQLIGNGAAEVLSFE